MRPASLAAAVAAALGGTAALAASPTTPSDLRVDVYSGTAAELFWSGSTDPDGAVSRYEIRRDGTLVDSRDGLSYFTDDLTDGRAFAFTVTAVDFDGMRSAPAAVSVVGGDRGGATGAGGGRPPPPANLTSSVYSSSAAEVFWDRADQRGLSYEVSVDGGPVTTTSGTSAFLSGLDGTRGRGVDVVAIDANGQRSGAANVTLGGGSGGGDPMAPVTPPSGGDAPAAPSSLRAERYSSNAGEVFWDRVSGARLSYEVRLDGEVVSTTTGTSHFAGDVPGIDGTRVEVVAIGPDGVRSSAASTTIGSSGTSSPGPDPDPNPGTDAPPAPANARIEVYSGTAAELFFDRAPAGTVSGTIVSRDGVEIGRTSGTSFFDAGRSPGSMPAYSLVAVGTDGRRSGETIVGGADPSVPGPERPPGGDPDGTIDLDALADGEGARIRDIDSFAAARLPLGVGDLDDDGFDDFMLPFPDEGSTVSALLVHGAPERLPTDVSIDGAGIGSSLRIVLDAPRPDGVGSTQELSYAPAGDLNADGIDDLAIAFPLATSGSSDEAGRVFVLYGRTGRRDGTVDLATLDAADGFEIGGYTPLMRAGGRVAGVGDVDGDGIDDLAIGADYRGGRVFLGASAARGVHVVRGSAGPVPARRSLSNIDEFGFRIPGPEDDDEEIRIGSLFGLDDFDGDGVADIGVAYQYGPQGSYLRVVPGGADVESRTGRLDDFTPSRGLLVTHESFGGRGPIDDAVALGDVDGDGLSDIALDGGRRSLVLRGAANPDPTKVTYEQLPNARVLSLAPSFSFDNALSPVGDVNGDGLADIGIGLRGDDDLLVQTVLFDATATTDTLSEEQIREREGLRIERPSVSERFYRLNARPAGDVDGDGADDFLLYRISRDWDLWLLYGRTS